MAGIDACSEEATEKEKNFRRMLGFVRVSVGNGSGTDAG